MFATKPPVHWHNGEGIACGAKLTKKQHELRTTSNGFEGRWRRYVTCTKCIAAIRRRIRQLADPATESEAAYARSLERLYLVRGR